MPSACFQDGAHAQRIGVANGLARHLANPVEALAHQQEKVDNPDATPSARILAKLESRNQGFFQFAMDQALAHRDHFLSRQRCDDTNQRLEALAADSLAEQAAGEAADQQSFEDYLADYFRD